VKIVVADDLPASALNLLTSEGWDVDSRTGRTPEALAADVADADALVVRSANKVTAAIIAAAPRLRARAGAGPRRVPLGGAAARARGGGRL
jgi:D-3-phosphoglycerate dehydrogenase